MPENSMIYVVERCYLALLNSSERVNRQQELCLCRDAISDFTGRQPQDVQDAYEYAALTLRTNQYTDADNVIAAARDRSKDGKR